LERGLCELLGVVTSEPAFDPKRARRLFSLGMADYVQALLLAPLLRSLRRAAPEIDLNIGTLPNLSELLVSGSLDLAISATSAIAPGLSTQALFEDGFVCMVRKGHPEVRGKLSLERYLSLRHVLVAPSGTPGSFVDTELERRGLTRRVALRVSSFLIAPVVVAETDFISTAPELLARRMAKRFALHIVPAPFQIPRFGLSMAWHPRFDDDPAHSWLREFVSGVSSKP
jgi:DNA-binding transcriptional LysR family regulator